MGFVLPFFAFIHMISYDITGGAVLPWHVLFFNGIAMFWYQTCDAIDGK